MNELNHHQLLKNMSEPIRQCEDVVESAPVEATTPVAEKPTRKKK
jgi:hypothetical protein